MKGRHHFSVAHHIPGRLRLKVARLKGQPAVAQDIHKRLSSINGVHHVHSDSSSGNILMHYDKQQRHLPEFLAALALPLSLVTDLPADEIVELFEVGERAPQVMHLLEAAVSTVTHGFQKLLRGQIDGESVAAIFVTVLGARLLFR